MIQIEMMRVTRYAVLATLLLRYSVGKYSLNRSGSLKNQDRCFCWTVESSSSVCGEGNRRCIGGCVPNSCYCSETEENCRESGSDSSELDT